MYWLGDMFHPLNFSELTTMRFHQSSGTVLAVLRACRMKSRTILARLPRVGAERLSDIERVEEAVGRPRVVDRRQVARNISRKLDCRIVEIVGSQIDSSAKAARFERGLPILGAQ